ncbi:MAG: extracellular solute-binding protein [bacterium]|nr:extracellular solute-binding protein [bacterium]
MSKKGKVHNRRPTHLGMSRRDFLKYAGFAAAAASASGALGQSRLLGLGALLAQDQIVLKTAGWPFADPLPTEEEIAADPTKQVYADILQRWLDEHPGVTIERIEFNIWDQQTLVTGLAGGVAPTAFHTTVLGNYNIANTRAAFAQGLAADVTEYFEALNIDEAIAPYVAQQMGKWIVDGRYYALPTVFNPGVGFIYRKDLFAEAGIPEPTPDWTWADLRSAAAALTTADRKGVALQRWALSWRMEAEGASQNPTVGTTTVVPDAASGWNWRYDFTSNAERWAEVIQDFRDMIFVDQSVFIDAAADDNVVFSALLDGRVAMAGLHPGFLRRSGEGSPDQVARDQGKTFEEMWGWVQQPRGTSGRMGVTIPFLDAISYSPDATDAELEAAVSLYRYFYLGEGLTAQLQALYDQTGELKRVWGEYPTLTGVTSYEGIPGGPADAWGAGVVGNFEAAASTPYPPEVWQFFPAETNPTPTLLAWGDFLSRQTFEPEVGDIAAELAAVEQSINDEAAAFFSSVGDEEFVTAAREYYTAQDAYLQANAPDYYTNQWKPWYDSTVAPVLE